MLGGRAFVKPLPYALGVNGHQLRNGIDTAANSAAQGIAGGKTFWFRNDVPWKDSQGGSTPIEGLPGVYSSTNVAAVATLASTLKAASLRPLFVITTNTNPGMCGTLAAALTSGNVYTSINITAQPYAITSGDSITLTNGPGGATQTIVAGAALAANTADAAFPVTSFTANAAYAVGSWVYDAVWNACTPQHFADMMSHLVAAMVTAGYAGLDYELLNEPDGTNWPVPYTLLYQMYSLAYPAIKAADSTATVWGPCCDTIVAAGSTGQVYYNDFVGLGGLSYIDGTTMHMYWSPGPPNLYLSGWGLNFAQFIATFQKNRIAQGDTKPFMITEYGWPTSGTGSWTNTPQTQAQWLQDLAQATTGLDTLNGVLFSSYLDAMMIYDCVGNDDADGWSILQSGGAAWPAVAVLTEVVSGR
jgi:hypothetical protein